MNRFIITAIIALALSFSMLHAANAQNYYRYGDVKTQLNKRAIVEIAKGELRRLVIQNKVPSSWKFAPFLDIEKINPDSSWIISFRNSNIKHTKNQILYIRISEKGNVLSNSYTRILRTHK